MTQRSVRAIIVALSVALALAAAPAATAEADRAPQTAAERGQSRIYRLEAAGSTGSGATYRVRNLAGSTRQAYVRFQSSHQTGPVSIQVRINGRVGKFRYPGDCVSVSVSPGALVTVRLTNQQPRHVTFTHELGWYRYVSGCGLG